MGKMDLYPWVLDLEAAAALVQCDPATLAERAQRGDVPGTKFGRGWIFPTEVFVAHLNEIAVDEAAARRRRTAPRAVVTTAAHDSGRPALQAVTPPPGGRQDGRRRARSPARPALPKLD